MTSTAPSTPDPCPRCGQGFHCGAAEAHCPCFDLRLSDALRQQLAQQYAGCLCLACLRELAAADEGAQAPR